MHKIEKQINLYQIGEFSKISQTSIKALRHYQTIGLLIPTYINEETAYRYYNEKLLERAKQISFLRSLDFSLKEIIDIFEEVTDDSDLFEIIEQKKIIIDNKIKKLKITRDQLSLILSNGEEHSMQNLNEITIVTIPDQKIASIRTKAKYSEIGDYFKKIYKATGMSTQGKAATLYFDDGYKENDAEFECYVPVKKEINKGEVTTRVLKGGIAYSLIHTGSYDTISESYKKMIDYLNTKELKTCEPCREIYLKGPGMIFKGNPDKYITEIQFIES